MDDAVSSTVGKEAPFVTGYTTIFAKFIGSELHSEAVRHKMMEDQLAEFHSAISFIIASEISKVFHISQDKTKQAAGLLAEVKKYP